MSRVRLALCATAVVLVMPVSVWAIGLGDYVARPHPLAFAYDPGDQARTRDLDFEAGAIGPADLSSTAESGEGEDGFYQSLPESGRDRPRRQQTCRPHFRSLEMDDPPDRLCRTDRGDVGPAPGAQSDASDLTQSAWPHPTSWGHGKPGSPNRRPFSFPRCGGTFTGPREIIALGAVGALSCSIRAPRRNVTTTLTTACQTPLYYHPAADTDGWDRLHHQLPFYTIGRGRAASLKKKGPRKAAP